MTRLRQQSRTTRWASACGDARTALEAARSALVDISSALTDLQDLQSEYQDWYDNMPEGLRDSSPTGEKLGEITNLNIDPDATDLDEIESMIDDLEGADLPLGWGKD
jgi:hypothetical protein